MKGAIKGGGLHRRIQCLSILLSIMLNRNCKGFSSLFAGSTARGPRRREGGRNSVKCWWPRCARVASNPCPAAHLARCAGFVWCDFALEPPAVGGFQEAQAARLALAPLARPSA